MINILGLSHDKVEWSIARSGILDNLNILKKRTDNKRKWNILILGIS